MFDIKKMARKIVHPLCKSFHVFDDDFDDDDENSITNGENVNDEDSDDSIIGVVNDDAEIGDEEEDEEFEYDDNHEDDESNNRHAISSFFDNEASVAHDDDETPLSPATMTATTSKSSTNVKNNDTKTEKMLKKLGKYSVSHFCAEITSSPPKVKDDKPIVVAQAILQHSKLLLLKFVYYLGKINCFIDKKIFFRRTFETGIVYSYIFRYRFSSRSAD